jgi:glycosyltransferase involved in cell wall biosynthesis
MRLGENPLKFSKKQIDLPSAITVGVINYIPEQTGYFRGQFDVLKLCLSSLRAHADSPFDLMVVDNGSCLEVQNYLEDELKADRIDYLILNRRNIGKANALQQILRGAPGEWVFYSDGDIYYYPGWIQAHLDVLHAFPLAGMVGGIPLRNVADFHTESTRRWAENNQTSLHVEKGDLIPEEWTRTFLKSIGGEQYIDQWIHNEDWRITRNGTTAYVGASHMQFLIPRRVIVTIPYHRFSQALNTEDDQYFDTAIEEAGFLRLSVTQPLVYHIGNVIAEDWLKEEYDRLVHNTPLMTLQERALQMQNSGTSRHWFWGRWSVRQILRKVYEWSFNRYYQKT